MDIVPGSLSAIARNSRASLAGSFLSVDVLLIVDVSGSMNSYDAGNGKTRYQAACDELKRIQGELPGKIGVIAFSNRAEFCPSGVPTPMFGGTDMVRALQFVKPADGTGIRFILISDGEPDDELKTLALARTFQSRIDVVYIGPEYGPGSGGRDFLKNLAEASGGQYVQNEVKYLASSVAGLLAGA